MTIKEVLKEAKDKLIESQVSEAESSAEFLLRHILGVDKAKFYSILDKEIDPPKKRKYQRYIKRRLKHEPVWQIIGQVEFWDLDFFVNQNVLIPRPETEFLVEAVLQQISKRKFQVTNKSRKQKLEIYQSLKTNNLGSNNNLKLKIKNSSLKILDVGTGAGPIICALAKEIQNSEFFASDVSKDALSVAKKNAQRLGLLDKISFKQGSLFGPWLGFKFDIVTANLPYIPNEDLGGLALEIHHYEPRIALDGGKGGLVLYEKFLLELPNHLKEGGIAYCEIGKGQGSDFRNLTKRYLKKADCEIIKDYAGFDRIAIVKTV